MRRVGPYSATIAWQTQSNSAARVVWGPAGMRPLLWTDSPWGTAHAVTLTGLASSTAYIAMVEAKSIGGQTTSTSLDFTTALAPGAVTGSTRDGVVLVNGNAFFPLLTWQECPNRWTPEIADGIDLFAGNTCTGLSSLLAGVNGRALAAGTSDDAQGTTGPGLLGWFYPDEADGRGLTAAMLAPPGPGLRFLTLTSHFFSGSAPLPDGRGIYPGLVASADVVGFDLYPLQEYCRPDLLPAVFDAQRQLVDLAPKKPTFQWIEVRQMKCVRPVECGDAGNNPRRELAGHRRRRARARLLPARLGIGGGKCYRRDRGPHPPARARPPPARTAGFRRASIAYSPSCRAHARRGGLRLRRQCGNPDSLVEARALNPREPPGRRRWFERHTSG